MTHALNEELHWNLDLLALQRYLSNLSSYAPEGCPDALLRSMIVNYHLDHQLVAALRDQNHAQHDAAWTDWLQQVLAILHHNGLAWSDDVALDAEDLAQIARAALVHSLGSYRYASRLSTWAHQVVVQSVRRALRDSRAAKRAGRPESLDQLPSGDLPDKPIEHPETLASAAALSDQIATILNQHGGPRLVAIFQLWAINDLRPAQIGALVALHPSRVRTLLLEARRLLQQHPTIQSWQGDAQNCGF